MGKRGGFTLIELLVVISIIALLLSVLMPALSKVKMQAKAVICLSNQRQWALTFSMYTQENNDRFMDGSVPEDSPYWWEEGGGGGMGSWWFLVLKPYYKEDKIRLCPAATKLYDEGGTVPFGAWNTPLGDSGSYGVNGYIINTPPGTNFIFGRPTSDKWKTINVRAGYKVPLMLDAMWVDGWPEHYDQPAEVEGWFGDVIGPDEMRRFCINRHSGFVNNLFFDLSARKVGLKELWRLKWSRGYNVNVNPPVWPDWMRKFKDY